MLEKGYESRLVCKLCNRKFPCGKSLRGHMRNHAEFPEKTEYHLKRSSSSLDDEMKLGESGSSSTWRAVDSKPPMQFDQICKQCGKGFQSLKALCGHMACHSEKDKGYSWSNENGKKVVFGGESDTESEEMKMRPRSSKSKRYKKVIDDPPLSAATHDSSSSDSEVYLPEDVAMCLMGMSRDVSVNNFDSVVESSDNNSAVVETKCSSIENGKKERVSVSKMPKESCLVDENESSDSEYFLSECKGEANDEVRRRMSSRHEDESRKRQYECLNCKKIFKSYQALGGHRPCSKRMKDSDDSDKKSSKNKTFKKNKEQACPFCNRVFKNGQALGGHKRSHFIGGET